MKKLWILIGVIILLVLAWYLISPAFNTIELDETSPITQEQTTAVSEGLDTMDPATKASFEEQVDDMKDDIVTMADDMPSDATVISQGTFQPQAHEVQGTAILIEKDNTKTLRFEDFETINGPDLRIYLSTTLGTDDFVELGKIKATKGNVNYNIPTGTDTTKYNKVLVWCKPFGVLFSYAELA